MYAHGDGFLQDCEPGLGEKSFASELRTAECRTWYAVYTKSRHEKFVHKALEERGIQNFLPLRNVLSQWKDRRKWVRKPLFPGYLFVRTEQMKLPLVTMTRGVAYVLGNGTEPVRVPDEQVEGIRRLVEGPYPIVHWPLLQKGKRVRVTAGPLAGLETYIAQKRGGANCHLVITVDLLGRSVAVEIDPRYVELIS